MRQVLWLSRVVLALIFVWFGALKLTGLSPVASVIEQATPFIMNTPYLYGALSWLEVLLGVGILIPRATAVAGWIMIAHLSAATGSVLISPQSFEGGFPALSVVGEFVVKNLALIALTLVIVASVKSNVKS